MPLPSSTPPSHTLIPPAPSAPSGPAEDGTPRPTFGLSLPQVLGSALASATAAVAASFLGVAGTLIGAVVGSVVATTGTAVYAHSIRTAGGRLTTRRTVTRSLPPLALRVTSVSPVTPAAPISHGPAVARPRRLRLAGGLVLGVVIALVAITGVERVLGHPISDSTSTGTSIGEAVTGSGASSSPVAPSVPSLPLVPTVSATGSLPTGTASATAPPTRSSSSSASPTGPPTASPTATSAPTATPTAQVPGGVPTAPITPAPTAGQAGPAQP